MSDDMDGSDVFVRAGDLVKNRSGVRFLSDIANTYVVDCADTKRSWSTVIGWARGIVPNPLQ